MAYSKNILKHCRSQFAVEEEWIAFQQFFNAVIYSKTRQEYEEAWDAMENTYTMSHLEALLYIQEEWLYFKKKFVKF